MGCGGSKQASVPQNEIINDPKPEITSDPLGAEKLQPELKEVPSEPIKTLFLEKACTDDTLGFFSFLPISRQAAIDLPADYTQKTAENKRNILWSNIIKDPYTYDVLPVSSDPLAVTYLINPLYLMTTFTLESDAVPGGRKKVFYPFGAAAKVTFKVTNALSPFTGIFKTGALGVMRFSLSSPVTAATDTATPAIALKLLVDGKPSQNLFAFNSLEASTNRNFFGKEFYTAAGKPHAAMTTVGDIFSTATRLLPRRYRPVQSEVLPIKGPASITPEGNSIADEDIVVPYKIIFTPSEDVKELMEPADLTDFRTQLNWIPPSAILFNVSACKDGEDPVAVGVIILDSSIVASRYADEYLFFQHPLFK